MKGLLTILIFIALQPAHAQNNIKYLENLVEKSFEEADGIVSKSNFKILKSNYIQSTSDTSLYGMEAKWKNAKNEMIYFNRMMDYVPLFSQEDSSEVGKAKVIKVTVSLIIGGQTQAENIINSLKLSKYKKVSSATPIGDGFEIKYESSNYELTYKKVSAGETHVILYYFIIRGKAYEIVDKVMYPKD